MTIKWTRQVARRDSELRQTADNASESLAKLRWGAPSAPPPRKGWSYTEYARQCGISLNQARTYAEAWEILVSSSDLDHRRRTGKSLDEHRAGRG